MLGVLLKLFEVYDLSVHRRTLNSFRKLNFFAHNPMILIYIMIICIAMSEINQEYFIPLAKLLVIRYTK